MDDMNRWTSRFLTKGQMTKLLDYAEQINEIDNQDIQNINHDADAIESSAMQNELAKKNQRIMELVETVAVLETRIKVNE